jgi:hypothetical protein
LVKEHIKASGNNNINWGYSNHILNTKHKYGTITNIMDMKGQTMWKGNTSCRKIELNKRETHRTKHNIVVYLQKARTVKPQKLRKARNNRIVS